MNLWKHHGKFERHSLLLVIGIVIVVSIGGLVEIAPLFWITKNTIEKVDGMRPYTPLELAGRDIYIREGCYVCHSQMIRPLRDEVERYGHYSLAAESMYDHPLQWGSKRTGPDLARVGGKYSDAWQPRPPDQSAVGREGVERLSKLIEEYGSAEGFAIGFIDDKETWYLENACGHRWLACRIPADSYFVI